MSHSIISEHYKNVLTERVKNAGCPCENFDDVLKNVRVLAKEQTKYGDEKAFWLDLSTKKIKACAGNDIRTGNAYTCCRAEV